MKARITIKTSEVKNHPLFKDGVHKHVYDFEISPEEYRTIGSYHIKRGPITLGDSNKERLK